jgi:glycosyltransferase involved in cell wall biosynthesis
VSRVRLLVVQNIPSPYQVDFLRALAARPEVDLAVVFAARTERDRSFEVPADLGFRATFLRGRVPRWLPKDWHPGVGLHDALLAAGPRDVAILGGSTWMPAQRRAARWLRRSGVPWCWWGEDPFKRPQPAWVRAAKTAWLRHVLRGAAGAFGVGRQATRTWARLLPRGAFARSLPYAPDLRRLLEPPEALREAARALRADLGGPEACVVLFSGSLTPRKAPDTLLEAFLRVGRDHPSLHWLVLGDGPMRRDLEDRVRTAGLAGRVRFAGFVHGDALRAAYLAADLFVLPTRTHEGWGVVVSEGLAAGVPVAASTRVRAADDLVREGTSGWRFEPDDVGALAPILRHAATAPQGLEIMALACRSAAAGVDAAAVSRDLAAFLLRRFAHAGP